MRGINFSDLEIPPGWHVEATKALAAVAVYANSSRTDRNEEIERHAAKTWRALKGALMDLSFEKCWYCEIRQDRSLGAVDHFRPKGKVLGVATHPGYWWLAFDETNYRFTCELCNKSTKDKKTGRVGGKKDQFPLWDESKRVMTQGPVNGIEEAMLLDPIDRGDPGLLTWMIDGSPAPRYTVAQNRKWHERASVSIRVYHLDHYTLGRRRRGIYNTLKRLVNDADTLYGNAIAGIHHDKSVLDSVTGQIMDLICPQAELSAAARQYISEFRTGEPKRQWLEAVISAA